MHNILDAMVPPPADSTQDRRRLSIAVTPQDAAAHPLGRELTDAWEAARARGAPLARRDIPSRPLLRLMPHLFLLEPLNEGGDWRFRLIGTAVTTRFGGDPTGLCISQLYQPEQVESQAAKYRRRFWRIWSSSRTASSPGRIVNFSAANFAT